MSNFISISVAILGFLFSVCLGFVIIPILKKLHFGQTILDIGPKWHQSKQGTPIMGGFIFVISTLLATAFGFILLSSSENDMFMSEMASNERIGQLVAGVVMALCMGFIGFMDDYIKAVKKQNLGLRARQKTALQILVCGAYLMSMYFSGMNSTVIPFIGEISILSGIGVIFWPIALIFIYGFTNAVNLTDGVDGLATSVTIVVSLFFMISFSALEFIGYTVLSTALVGALIGFLVWNLHPAKVFMGDTGSMFLGGIVVAFAFAINRPILLFLAGILYLVEAMSVVIQVAYYKKTKKRLFKMSPIHHHFEMSGWSENKIVLNFSIVTVVGCAIALVLIII